MKKQNDYLHHNRQQGVVLFIALIALVVMSLAAAALIRNVDTNTMIAGNLSFQQSALISASRGYESALAWLESESNKGVSSLYTSAKTSGYYAIYGDLNGSGVDLDVMADLKNEDTWDKYSAAASGTGITVAGIETKSQNVIRYIIERMCSKPVAAANDKTNKCLMGKTKEVGNSHRSLGASGAGAVMSSGDSPIYRVTVRVTGPRNTQNYSQVYAY